MLRMATDLSCHGLLCEASYGGLDQLQGFHVFLVIKIDSKPGTNENTLVHGSMCRDCQATA